MDEAPPEPDNPDGGWVGKGWQDRRHMHHRRRFPLIGLVLLTWGILWLGRDLGYWDLRWRYAAPVALILIGAASLLRWGSRSW